MKRVAKGLRFWVLVVTCAAFATISVAKSIGLGWIIFEAGFDFIYASLLMFFFFTPVIITTWTFGYKAGVISCFIMGALMLLQVIGNRHSLDLLLGIAAIMVIGVGTSWLIDRQQKVERLLKQSAEGLKRQAVELERELTERKQAEEALAESEERFRSVAESASDAIISVDEWARIIQWNDAAETILGYSADEVIGKPLSIIMPERFREHFNHGFKQMVLSGELPLIKNIFEKPGLRKDGNEFPAEISVATWKTSKGIFFTSIVRDITERRQAEEEMRIKDSAIASSINGIGIADLEGKLTYINPAFLELWGYEDDNEVLGKSGLEFWQTEGKAARVIKALKEKGSWMGEMVARKKDRSTFDVQISANMVSDENGRPICLMAYFVDVTELRRAQKQLQHSQLLASLGEMTAGIAHEVNNPLSSILLYSELLMANNVSRQTRKDLRVIHDEAKRATRVMADLLTYGRRLKPRVHRLDLHSILNRVLDMRQYQQRVQNIIVSTSLRDGPLYVRGNSSQLMQVFINLILNAEEALKESKGGNIIITTQIDGEWARVLVADDGTGIPQENLKRVFYPFFTTKQIGEGAGLGLSACYGIVTAHNGLIHAENNEMGGATFTVELLLAETREKRGSLLGKNDESGEQVTEIVRMVG